MRYPRRTYLKFKKVNKGAAIVEFALLTTLLMLIIFGIISFGFVFYNSIILEQASRTAARGGITSAISNVGFTSAPPGCEVAQVETDGSSTDAEITAACIATNFLDGKLIKLNNNSPNINVSSTPSGCTPSPECYLTVNITFNNSGIFAFDVIQSNAETSMYYE